MAETPADLANAATLPATVTAGDTGHVAHSQTLHRAVQAVNTSWPDIATTAATLRVIHHAGDATYARPAGGPALWVGTVQPDNMVAGDIYAAATSTPLADPWTPTQITGLQGWYDPTTLGLADGASLTGWTDSSGLGRDLVAGGEAPTFSAAGLGGHPATAWNGATVGTLDVTIPDPGTVPIAVFCNFTVDDASAIRALWGAQSATDFTLMTRSTNAGVTARRGGSDLQVSQALTNGQPYGLTIVYNGANSQAYLDGTLVGTGTMGELGGFTRFRLGRRGDGSYRAWGLIGDVFWMSGVPDAQTLTDAHSWLAARRGI